MSRDNQTEAAQGHEIAALARGPWRRRFLKTSALLGMSASSFRLWAVPDTSEGVTFADGPRPLVRYPGKRELIRVSTRPPHLETPFELFDAAPITPNDAFFVRYHLADIPVSVDLATYRIAVRGEVARPLSLSLNDLKGLGEHVEVVAVNQCSGNSRGFAQPRVFGAQLANGAMGNARWLGVRMRDVLRAAGVKPSARQVVFDGLDKPVLPSTPDFRKALDIEHALGGDPMLAWQMNGEDIPYLNGFPVKLIVPGWFGTYWVKHVSDIEVISRPFEGHDAFFMTSAYRVPDNDCLCVAPGGTAPNTRPISTLPVRSFITNVRAGAQLHVGRATELRGIAFDSGAGLKAVDVSTDGGRNWKAAKLGPDLGRFSFREWRYLARFDTRGPTVLMVRASNRLGETQTQEPAWNPAGYRRHSIESTAVMII